MNEALTLTDSLDVSIWGLILQADIVVRLVMFILLLLSIISWSLIFEKYTKLRRLNRKAESFENEFWSGMNIEKIHKNIGNNSSHPMEAIFLSGMKELNNSPLSKNLSAVDNQIIGNRIEKRMLHLFLFRSKS